MRRNPHVSPAAVAGLACLIVAGAACGGPSSHEVTLLLDRDCRDSGDIFLDDGTRWMLNLGSSVPTDWRGQAAVTGALTTTQSDSGYFVAGDGTRLAVTTGFRKVACTLWE